MNDTYRLGVDIGSTTAKIVLLDPSGEPAYSAYRRHNTETLAALLKDKGNRIKAKFRVKGNMDDPRFDLQESVLTRIAFSFENRGSLSFARRMERRYRIGRVHAVPENRAVPRPDARSCHTLPRDNRTPLS